MVRKVTANRTRVGGEISGNTQIPMLRRGEKTTRLRRRRYGEARPRIGSEITESGRDLLVPIHTFGEWIDAERGLADTRRTGRLTRPARVQVPSG